jgi:hypothetical protein
MVVLLIFTLFWMNFASEKLERSDKRGKLTGVERAGKPGRSMLRPGLRLAL